MLRALPRFALAAGIAAVSAGTSIAGEKREAPAADPPAANPCDVYGPDYKPVGASGTCVKLGGSIEFDVGITSTGGHPSVTTSTDWIRTKPARKGN